MRTVTMEDVKTMRCDVCGAGGTWSSVGGVLHCGTCGRPFAQLEVELARKKPEISEPAR